MRPQGCWITVNRKCNLRCVWCYAKGTNYTNLKIKFEYDMLKDAESWVKIAKSKNIYGMDYDYMVNFIPKDLLKFIQEASREDAVRLVRSYLEDNYNQYNGYIALFKQSIQTLWEAKEKEYIKRLEEVTKKPFIFEQITCYITTCNMCPYNFEEKWFTISIRHPLPNTIMTIAHELLHFQTHKYFDVDEDTKEALTFILNENEFNNLFIVKDNGYKQHQELREKLSKKWRANKNFEKLLD